MTKSDTPSPAASPQAATSCAPATTGGSSPKFTGKPLPHLVPTPPSWHYFNAEHFQHELDNIWYREWLCLGRCTDLDKTGQYHRFSVGDQRIFVVRSETGELRGFHDTCKHRGSTLCEASRGRFKGNRIVCPYHAWTYALDGKLMHTPWRLPSDDFDTDAFPLLEVSVGEWGGNVFLNLDPDPAESLQGHLGGLPELFENWRLETCVSTFRMRKVVDCNWKIFWENFTECYHCPGIHPELCRIVPRFSQGILRNTDLTPGVQSPSRERLLAEGAVTWSDSGETDLPYFKALSEEEVYIGQTFGVLSPSCFIAAHVDFVRFGHILPIGPEQTEVTIECLFPEQSAALPESQRQPNVEFIERLTLQDLRVCELNQRGMHARPHQHGVLVPQEYYTYAFQQWVHERMSATEAS